MDRKKNKICYVASTDMAVKFLLLNQLKFLRSQGFDVTAVCPAGKFLRGIEAEGIKVKTIDFNRGFNPFLHLATIIRLFFYFKKEKPDIVHTHNPVPGFLGQLAAKFAGVPIIVNTIHGLYFTERSSFLKRKVFIFTERLSAKCSTLIFSQNKEDMETMIKEGICKPQKIKYLGNGIDLKKFNPDRFSADFIYKKKKELNLDSRFRIIGIVGRLVKEKGYSDLFKAFSMVLQKFPETILVCIGPKEAKKNDSVDPTIAVNYGIAEKTVFLGERTDVDELYPLMDIFVLPSLREGFPRSVLEASAMQRPIVATDIRGCREAVKNGETGVLVPPSNPESLALAIASLINDANEAERLAKNARKMAISEFDESRIYDMIKTNYEALLEGKMHAI